jgi:malic enzyme
MDVRAKSITENMKLAAAHALAKLAKEKVPDYIEKIYNRKLSFGKDYIIPTPFDKRVLWYVAPAVAKAAIDEGVNLIDIDIKQYTKDCEELAKTL